MSVAVEIVDRDGGWIRTEEYDTVESMLADWPNAEFQESDSDTHLYTAWAGDQS